MDAIGAVRRSIADAQAADAGPAPELGVILDALPAMVGYWDSELRNRVANRAYVDFFGMTPDEIHGRHISELLGPELYALNRPYMEGALAGEPQLFDRTIIDPNGAPRYTQASYVPDIVDGEVRGFVALVTDITARRVAEQARAAAEARFRLAFTRSPVGMALMDTAGRILEVNPALCEMLGYAEGELRGRPLAELMRSDGEQAQPEGRLDLSGETGSVERRAIRRDGSLIWVILSLALAKGDGERETLAIGQLQDITASKAAEGELRRSREQLAEAEQVAQIGSWEWDIEGDHTTWSDGLFKIYGLTPGDFSPSLEDAAQRVHPDDWERVRAALDRAIADCSPFTVEYRAVRPDGRVRSLRSRGDGVVDESGRPTRLVGVVQDITETKLAQEALQSTSAELERHATELQQLALRAASERASIPQAPLTQRQLEILKLIAQGSTNAAIAERLVVTEGTVKWHVKQILAKTGSANRAEAVARVLGEPGLGPAQG